MDNVKVGDILATLYTNKNATIVFWNTGEKTVVKCQKGETFDKEKGFFAKLGAYVNIEVILI